MALLFKRLYPLGNEITLRSHYLCPHRLSSILPARSSCKNSFSLLCAQIAAVYAREKAHMRCHRCISNTTLPMYTRQSVTLTLRTGYGVDTRRNVRFGKLGLGIEKRRRKKESFDKHATTLHRKGLSLIKTWPMQRCANYAKRWKAAILFIALNGLRNHPNGTLQKWKLYIPLR